MEGNYLMNESMVIPKSYRGIIEKKFGMSYTWLTVASIFAIFSAFFAILIMFSGIWGKLFFSSILLLSWFFFWKYLRNDDLLEEAKLSYLYFMRLRYGQTAVSKYDDANILILKQFLPIEAIHPNGLIQYTDNLYFLLLKYIPVRLSDDLRDSFLQNTISVLNSLQDGIAFKFFVVSRNSYDDSFEKQILTAANRPNTAPSTKEHLFSLHKTVSGHTDGNIKWDFYISFGIGTYDTPQEAEVSRQTLLTGLHDLLERVEADIHVVESPQEITYALYNCITQEV
jgi:hypothetical protein